ncbi:MAG: hypothetical protein ACK40L_08095 [Hydrogenophaga sp.]
MTILVPASTLREKSTTDVLKVRMLVARIAPGFAVCTLFHNKCLKSTGYPLLMDTTIFGFAMAGWIICIGISRRRSLIQSGGDVLNGTLVAVGGDGSWVTSSSTTSSD